MSNNTTHCIDCGPAPGLLPAGITPAAGPRAGKLPAALAGLRSRHAASALTVAVGFLVGIYYVLAKFAVQNGVAPVASYFWQLLGAGAVLLVTAAARRQRLVLTVRYLRYYLFVGIVGAAVPNLLAFRALQHVPAGVFTVLITLSPMLTFAFASLAERKLLPLRRLVGVLIGFSGVSLATLSSFSVNGVDLAWILIAGITPALLALNNVYRSRAYPAGAEPLSIGLGTLLMQVILVGPAIAFGDRAYNPLHLDGITDVVVLAMGPVSALSLVLILHLQKLTDGLGTSQVSYFITLTGLAAGAAFFGEAVGFGLIASVALAFLGVAVTNGHLGSHTFMRLLSRGRKLLPRNSSHSTER